ncbi:putative homeobox-leucine zipper protein HOX3-like [Cocos nucifera]|uniref:Putative homeobox-leucine zipper protein HOX3-like n=1 Tax=Cocos nucifera TaxID=13894 RepID=A0A8K0I9V9_COCNU|nr:putative homeobox-leucine zipper protein HOX3-like [Cocos nucifera]
MRDIDINLPAPEAEEELPMGGPDNDMVKEGTKPKRLRLSPVQTWVLEEAFKNNPTLESMEKDELAAKLDILPRQVEVWYQNHKASGHNMRDIDINLPAPEAEEELPMGGPDNDMVKEGTKPKRLRLSPVQTWVLEEAFKNNPTLESMEKDELAAKLDILPRQVEVWYQNHKARTKARQMETENACLKQQCRLLLDENMRLRREIERLRALNMPPPTSTVTMCLGAGSVAPTPGASTTNHQPQPPSTK